MELTAEQMEAIRKAVSDDVRGAVAAEFKNATGGEDLAGFLADSKAASERFMAEQRSMVEDLRADRKRQGQVFLTKDDPLWLGRYAVASTRALLAQRERGGNVYDLAEEFCKERGSEHLGDHVGAAKEYSQARNKARAMSSDTAAGGGILIPPALSDDVVEAVRPASRVLSMGPMAVPMVEGSMEIPYVASGTSVTWTGAEDSGANEGSPTIGEVVLRAKPAQSLAAISNKLIRRTSNVAAQLVQNDIVAAFGTAFDVKYIRGLGTQGVPKGLRYWAASANVNAMTAATLAGVRADVAGLLFAKVKDGVPAGVIQKGGFLMSNRSWAWLLGLTDGLNNAPFENSLLQGKFYNLPNGETANIPDNLGGATNESEVYLADFAHIMVGSPEQFEIALSTEAAYPNSSGTLVSAFSKDQTVIRVSGATDLVDRLRGASIAVLSQVTWGV